jgi:fatty acid-binding protein DegV
LLEVVEERIGAARVVRFAVAHGDAAEDALYLKREIEARFHQPVPYICEFSPVIGVHTGPGVFGTAFYIEE